MATFRKCVMAAVTAMLLAWPAAGAGANYLPAPCADSPYPPPDWFQCPVPYVELIPPAEGDPSFERAWHCRETGHSLGFVRGGDGCGGGLTMFKGWSIPPEEALPDYRTEIMEQVIKPCWLTMARRHEVEGLTSEQLALGAMAANPDTINDLTDQVIEMMADIETPAERELLYTMVRQVCITSSMGG